MNSESAEGESAPNAGKLSIEKACEEYSNSVKLTLEQINHQLDDVLLKNSNGLDELALKIAARTNFLEKNPSFLSCLVYDGECVKIDRLLEFDDIKITLKEHTKRIQEKLEEIEKYHKRLLHLVARNGREKLEEDEFQDCIDKLKSSSSSDSQKKTEIKVTFPARPLESKNSFDKVTIRKDAYADGDPQTPPAKFQIFPDIIPDVERRKPTENIHGKLMQQIVATDSLEGFLKLMDRKPKRLKPKEKKTELERKYEGSLWFFSTKETKKTTKTVTVQKKIRQVPKLETDSSQPPLTNQDQARRMRLGLSRNKLKYYDLLDDIDHNDLKPIQSEYPRRDNIQIKIQDSGYLQRMLHENDKVWKTLLQPEQKKKKTEKKKAVAQPGEKEIRNLMEYLTSPQQKYLNSVPTNVIVMPVKVMYDRIPTKDKSLEAPRNVITDLTKDSMTRKTDGRLSPVPMERRKEMLDQLKGLKMKNDNIQKNIQKAIDVIETKMIDLLSSPKDATSSDAFNAMEREITQVLKMMHENEEQAREDNRLKKIEEKVEPEKDENQKVSPKLRRAMTIVKKTHPDGKREKSADSKKSDGGNSGAAEKKSADGKKTDGGNSGAAEKKSADCKKTDGGNSGAAEKKSADGKKTDGGNSGATEKKSADCKNTDGGNSGAAEKKSADDKKTDGGNSGATEKKEETKTNEEAKTKEEAKNNVEKKEEEKKPVAKTHENVEKKDEKKPPVEKPTPEVKKVRIEEKRRPRSKERPKPAPEPKKAADIEEGERLLGQVDSVIKKIDSIYNRFYDEGKKTTPKPESKFTNIAEFFVGIKQKTETVTLLDYKRTQSSAWVFSVPTTFCHWFMYYDAKIEQPPPVLSEPVVEKKVPDKEEILIESEEPEIDVHRHDSTLRMFYGLFFSGVFAVLNLDYAA